MPEQLLLTIAHSIFLTKEERYRLGQALAEVTVPAIALPVWMRGFVTSEPAEEIIAKYVLRNFVTPGLDVVHVQNDGFLLTLTNDQVHALLDPRDGGSACLYYTHQQQLNDTTTIVNYVYVQDVTALKETSAH